MISYLKNIDHNLFMIDLKASKAKFSIASQVKYCKCAILNQRLNSSIEFIILENNRYFCRNANFI